VAGEKLLMSEIAEQLTTTEGRDWLAMQFVLGELTEQQSVEFDAALLNDSTVCDAVVNATCLMSGIALAFEPTPVVSRVPVAAYMPVTARVLVTGGPRGRRVGIVLTAAAAMGVMAAFVYSQFLPVSSFVPMTSLATAADLDAADAFVSLLPDETPADISTDDEDFVYSEDSLADLAAPEWLLTAVELEQDQTDSKPPVDDSVY